MAGPARVNPAKYLMGIDFVDDVNSIETCMNAWAGPARELAAAGRA
jgi:hypothetical protein